MSKVCNDCNTEHSAEWSLSKELAKSNKRMFIILLVVIALWFTTIAGFVVYLNQYDFTDYEVQQDGEWGNTFIGGTNEGDINYGAENTSEDANTQEP